MSWEIYKSNEYINLRECLFSGQCFSFIEISHTNTKLYNSLRLTTNIDSENMQIYHGILENNDFYLLENDSKIFYMTDHVNAQLVLDKFFIADLNYKEIFTSWQNMTHTSFKYNGLRLLQVSHIECIFSFICSQNNNIKRISKMVLYLKKTSNNFCDLNFCENDLKNNKFGYRAKYIIDAANKIKESKLNLHNLSCNKLEYDTIRNFLLSIKGIGRKVCDCILLMGFGFVDTVPIDVHIHRISSRLFNIDSKLTCNSYSQIQNKYKEVFGKYCGIAQLYLFKHSLDKKK